jgi:peptide/nickel transport system substrate-binding protein
LICRGLQRRAKSAVLLFAILAAIATGATASSLEPKLVIGVGRDFFDGPDSRTYLHGSTHTWEALTYLDEGLEARPWLAESWDSPDGGRTWVFRLREGVRFHDGSLLTAEFAKASIQRIVDHRRYDPTGVYRHLVRLETEGKRNLVFRLKEPSVNFPNLVSYYSSPVIHPRVFAADGKLTGLIGTGPYRIEEIHAGDRVVLRAFDDHWGPKPAYDRVVFRTLLDAQTRVIALLAGDVDAVADVGAILPQQAGEIESAPGITLSRVEVATTHYLLFNCRKPPFRDAEARHWLAGVLDRETLVSALAPGAGRVAEDPFTPLARNWAFGNLHPGPGQKPKPPGVPLILLLHAGTIERWPYRDIAQIAQAQLEGCGFASKIVIREPGAYYEDLQQGRFHIAFLPTTLMTGDPDFFYSYYVASDGPRSFDCGTREMDELIRSGRRATKVEERRSIYRKLSARFAAQMPLLPIYHDFSLYAFGKSVGSFAMDHNFRPLLIEARPRENQ